MPAKKYLANAPLTREDLYKELMTNCQFSRRGAQTLVDETLQVMAEHLVAGEDLSFRKFGIISSRFRPQRNLPGALHGKVLKRKRELRFAPTDSIRKRLRIRGEAYFVGRRAASS